MSIIIKLRNHLENTHVRVTSTKRNAEMRSKRDTCIFF